MGHSAFSTIIIPLVFINARLKIRSPYLLQVVWRGVGDFCYFDATFPNLFIRFFHIFDVRIGGVLQCQ